MREIKKGEILEDISTLLTDKGVRVLETERMKEIFRDTCNFLLGLHLLEQSYVHMLVMYAYYLGRWEDLSMEIAIEGVMIESMKSSPKGDPFVVVIVNPKIAIQKQCGEAAAKIADLFGLTPVSRQKMPNGKIEEDPAKKLMEALERGA